VAGDTVSATAVVDASADAIFAVLADPTRHAAIDGTGWVTESVDCEPLTAAGQVFRMAMYHPDHPDGGYETANQVVVFERPTAIAWRTGYYADEGDLRFGGWLWRYDLAPTGPSTSEVTLTYDWSAVGEDIRGYIQFPPFGADHLANSLAHLAELATAP
jgi:hypothetical protein